MLKNFKSRPVEKRKAVAVVRRKEPPAFVPPPYVPPPAPIAAPGGALGTSAGEKGGFTATNQQVTLPHLLLFPIFVVVQADF